MAVITYIIVAFFLILSGLFSGLTLGLMGLDTFELKRRSKLGDIDAKRIYPLRKKGNLLLSTLLLGNVAVNSALAIFLGSVSTGLIAGITATGLIVIFGEIIPQSVFSKHALKLGAKTTWIVYIFLFFLYPVTKPISMALDKFLGSELPTSYSKKEFEEIIQEQKNIKDSGITSSEFRILKGGVRYSHEVVKNVMTPRIKTYFLDENDILDEKLKSEIVKKGHSRIPILCKEREKVVGILYAKDLINADCHKKTKIKSLMRKRVIFVEEDKRLSTILSEFKKRKVHLFIVNDDFKGISGIITLEDVLEEIVGEIVDEYDQKVDMRK